MIWSIREIRERVFLVEASNQYYLNSMFMRPQEYYESPFINIREKYFTVEEYMDTYAKCNGEFSYFTDWDGFNIPSNNLLNFFRVFEYNFTKKERILFELVKNKCGLDSKKPFYIIGTVRTEKNNITLKHELSHAYYYLYDYYKESMRKLIDENVSDYFYDCALHALDKYGYNESVFEDEIIAYLSSGDINVIISTFGWSKFKYIKELTSLKTFFNKFDKYNDILSPERKIETSY